ncbi:hypothetical protein [Lichenifustis flavocetrariae]|uniref:TonB C-terminal domain-containing protein n=1 Tax=Lichenifustis flavocetrariae TaxID=2949735 RepID=A0AA42CK69_9HYPH|nr:hypothetical protein [Lichenifustis flavocetrariae]MCW6510249.1 hypothetical protein [Lichenifustis flavocetrariae]
MVRFLAVIAFTLTAGGAPVSTLKDLGSAFASCTRTQDYPAGSEITIRLSLNSRGAILGKPMITYSRLIGSMSDRRAFVADVLDALRRCTPVNVTSELGRAIAGRPLSIHVVGGAHGLEI